MGFFTAFSNSQKPQQVTWKMLARAGGSPVLETPWLGILE
jgi:hypothetical protein